MDAQEIRELMDITVPRTDLEARALFERLAMHDEVVYAAWTRMMQEGWSLQAAVLFALQFMASDRAERNRAMARLLETTAHPLAAIFGPQGVQPSGPRSNPICTGSGAQAAPRREGGTGCSRCEATEPILPDLRMGSHRRQEAQTEDEDARLRRLFNKAGL